MIIDVHSHAWNFPADFSADFIHQAARARPGVTVDLSATYEAYRASAPADTITLVFGGKARLSGLWVDDRTVAEYAARDAARLIGFMALDPTQDGWEREMRTGHEDLGLRGIKLMPMYEGECLVTIRKHENVFADVSALHYRPWQLYNSLMLAQEYGVWHKLLFGSDFPFTTVNASIEGIRKLNIMLEGTKLPRLDMPEIEAMIHRDSLAQLGLKSQT